ALIGNISSKSRRGRNFASSSNASPMLSAQRGNRYKRAYTRCDGFIRESYRDACIDPAGQIGRLAPERDGGGAREGSIRYTVSALSDPGPCAWLCLGYPTVTEGHDAILFYRRWRSG